jgi:hypothetical protein
MIKFMKIALIVSSIFFICFNGAIASTYTFMDHIQIYKGNNKHPSYTADNSQDFVGDDYDTEKVIVSLSDNDGMTIDIFTKFDGFDDRYSADIEIADFFLDFDLDGSYEVGVDLSWNSSRVYSTGAYSSLSSSSWITSYDKFDTTDGSIGANSTAYWYYGRSLDSNGNEHIIVDFDTSTSTRQGDITVKTTTENSDPYPYIYNFNIDTDLLTDLGYTPSKGFGFFFATAECGNDVISGAVPEPGTFLLFGIGLLGLGAIGRKRKM